LYFQTEIGLYILPWNILKQLIRSVFHDDDIYQSKLAEIFEKCMHSYSFQGKKGDNIILMRCKIVIGYGGVIITK
jgi:hypothetical protein